MKRLCFILFIFVPGIYSHAQPDEMSLSVTQVKEWVLQYHPAAKRARIEIERAKAELTRSRGLFDPYFSTKIGEKTFDGTDYYRYSRPQLTIPTWMGVELRGGFENLQGDRLNPEATRGQTNFLGVSLPLAKNLLLDKRRAALQQAKITTRLRETEWKSILNNTLFEALQAYWNWVQRFQVSALLKQVVTANERRLDFVKTTVRMGDRPAIDTTEALTQLQSFQLALNESEWQLLNATRELTVFLWTANEQPFELSPQATPDLSAADPARSIAPPVAEAISGHPDLVQYDRKLEGIRIDQKLKFQSLLPEINLEYNRLGKGYRLLQPGGGPLLENNYRFGLSIGIPLRLSEGRGEYKSAKLKLLQTQLERDQKERELSNKVLVYRNTLQWLDGQVRLQRAQVSSFQLLQRAEETRFNSGESSLFLVNSRETKALEARQKLVELEIKFAQATIALQWAAGLLADEKP